ncbi:Decaprenyl diphosphate synthase-like, partial [Sesbania bispinosa]
MFSLRLPVPVPLDITLTSPPSKTNLATTSSHSHRYSYSPSQTHRFPSQPVTVTKRGTATAPPIPNVALQGDAADEGNSIIGDSPEAEPLPPELRPELMPKHVAVIMDGNGRWAKMRGLPPWAGHEAGARSMIRLMRLCCSWGIKVLTVFAFSIDNWVRPKVEVDFLMSLFERTINSNIEAFKRDGIQICVIGDSSQLPKSLQKIIISAEESTKENSRLQLIVAISYSGKYDMVQACKSVAKKVKDGLVHLEDINENIIEQELETNCTEFPNPDLLIRTSGELR